MHKLHYAHTTFKLSIVCYITLRGTNGNEVEFVELISCVCLARCSDNKKIEDDCELVKNVNRNKRNKTENVSIKQVYLFILQFLNGKIPWAAQLHNY